MDRTILRKKKEVIEWFSNRKPVYSYDWETTGLDYMKMEPVGVSFCDGERTTYIDLWENAEANEILDILGPIFERGTFIAHNNKFDIKCIRKFCHTEPTDIFCTFIASFLLDENRSAHGLKVLAVEDLSVDPAEVEKWDKASEYGYTSTKWYQYCFNDAEWAWYLYLRDKPMLTMQGLDHLFYDIEMPFQFVLVDMEINGVKVDIKELEALELRTRNKLIELEDRMMASIGKRVLIQLTFDGQERLLPVNLRSTPQLIKVVEKDCGVKVPFKKDKDGKMKQKMNKQVLLELKGKHPFIDYLIDYKKVRKLYDAYIIPTFQFLDSDGRIRPSYGIVKTGRLNCRNPNLQQLPNTGKQFSDLNYRAIFVSDDGCKLVGGDYSGQELRVLGAVSGDQTIIQAFLANQDLHLVTANYIFNLGLDNLALTLNTKQNVEACRTFKTERYKAKNGVNFPIVYGSSEYGISRNMGVDIAVAKEWQRKFFELYPGVKHAMEMARENLEEFGYVSTMMGRRRRFLNYQYLPKYAPGKKPSQSRCVRQGFNFEIQGFSADQVKIAAINARRHGLKIILMVHDEIVTEGGMEAAESNAVILRQCMENAVSLSIPFISDVKIGDRYNDLK